MDKKNTPKTITANDRHNDNEEILRRLVNILQHPSQSIQEFLDYSLKQVIELSGSQIGYIYHYNEATTKFVLNTWSEEVMKACYVNKQETTYQLDKTGIWGEAVRQRRPIVINNYQKENPFKKGYPKGHVPLTNFLTIPIFKNDQIVGVVGLANKETDFDDTDILNITLLMEAVWTVAESKKVEEELNQTSTRLTLATRAGRVGIWDWDIKSDKMLFDDLMLELYDLPEKNYWVADKVWQSTIHPDDLEQLNIELNRAIQEKTEYNFEFRVVWRNGSIHNIRALATVQYDDLGNAVRMIGTNWDITAAKESHARTIETNRRLQDEIIERKILEEELKDLAIKDQLTGLYNRRKIDQVLMKEKDEAESKYNCLSVIMADIDMFKLVNDQYGHLVGDQVLMEIAAILTEGIRSTDILGRWGGEEFIIICTDTDLEGATILAEKLRELVAGHEFNTVGKKTCSFGVAQLRKEETIDKLLLRSDLALYRAKERGRNRVEQEICRDKHIKEIHSLQKKTRG